MKSESKIRYLLRAARRAEVRGDVRTARNFRRMAAEVRPLDARGSVPEEMS
ncbi:MAG: hypothetical protein HKN73_18085 [Gemmatimonadetes bacterium]|nr:hypothetical protein [Gemmatimonadota bacterium]